MITLSSPAKVNLFLRVLGRRPDGYHELASLFQTISLKDTLHLSLSNEDKLTCSDPTLPTDGSNLVLKAANLFRKKTDLSFKVAIHLEKHIPCQAGLGGGSSNAATTLWGLNKLLGEPASVQQLMQWSSEIGSDISFFFSQGTAYCTGRGEIVQAVNQLKQKKCWVIKPSEGLSTPTVYKMLDLSKLQERNPTALLNQFIRQEKEEYFNDLEQSAFMAMPSLYHLKNALLESGFHTVLMTGSGSAFFCLGEGKAPQGLFSYSATFINRTADNWYN